MADHDADYGLAKAILRSCGLSSEGVVSVVYEARFPDLPTLTVTRRLPDVDVTQFETRRFAVNELDVSVDA